MSSLQPRDLSIDEAASFLGVSGSTIRRRLGAGELRSVKSVDGTVHVRLVPLEDWLRLQDAAGLLGVATSTVRAQATRGLLVGKRVEGKWMVKLVSVLEDPRCDPAAVELFGGTPAPATPPQARERPPANVHRPIYVRLSGEEAELLERLRERYGSITAAVVTGLRSIDEEAFSVDDLAELRAELHTKNATLERVQLEHANLHARAQERMVDELYCPACEKLVPIEDVDLVLLDDGTAELVHRGHRHRQASKLSTGTVAGRRKLPA